MRGQRPISLGFLRVEPLLFPNLAYDLDHKRWSPHQSITPSLHQESVQGVQVCAGQSTLMSSLCITSLHLVCTPNCAKAAHPAPRVSYKLRVTSTLTTGTSRWMSCIQPALSFANVASEIPAASMVRSLEACGVPQPSELSSSQRRPLTSGNLSTFSLMIKLRTDVKSGQPKFIPCALLVPETFSSPRLLLGLI